MKRLYVVGLFVLGFMAAGAFSGAVIADVTTSKKRLQMQTEKLQQQVVKLDTQARQALAQNPEARYSMEELSVADAFEDLPEDVEVVVIHDAARPFASRMAQASTAPAAANANPHAGLDAPVDPVPKSAGQRVSGTVDLDPSLKNTLSPGAILFVFARASAAKEEESGAIAVIVTGERR